MLLILNTLYLPRALHEWRIVWPGFRSSKETTCAVLAHVLIAMQQSKYIVNALLELQANGRTQLTWCLLPAAHVGGARRSQLTWLPRLAARVYDARFHQVAGDKKK